MMRHKACKLYDRAKRESHSDKWSVLLDTVEKKIRFEDGFVRGWQACEKYIEKCLKLKER
jgi:hypothetical protein